uniref:UDP-glucose 4-epimerase n=1 Tax=Romanomermis culicivorax TaxID=13658 RepID=A0A915HHS4_ROMCU
MKNILVTGAAGFIGSHSVVELLNAGYETICVDNFANAIADKDGYPVSLRRVEKITGKKIIFYNVDTIDSSALEKIFDQLINLSKKVDAESMIFVPQTLLISFQSFQHKIDCVMHFAALKSVAESVSIPLTYYSNNLTGTISLLEVMKKKGVKNFIFSSSCTVYGDPQKLPINEEHPTGQNIPTPYGKSKFMMEEILKDLWNAEKDWNVILLRYFNPVGAHSSGLIGEDPKGIPNNLMPYVSQVAVGKLPYVRVYGNDYDTIDGTGVRDYIHVVDLAKGHVVAIKQLEANGCCKVFNLGTGHGYSVLQMIKALEKASGKEIPYKIEGRRPGDIATVFCDTTKATQQMGWKSELGLDEMCRDLWKWQSLNPQGFSA